MKALLPLLLALSGLAFMPTASAYPPTTAIENILNHADDIHRLIEAGKKHPYRKLNRHRINGHCRLMNLITVTPSPTDPTYLRLLLRNLNQSKLIYSDYCSKIDTLTDNHFTNYLILYNRLVDNAHLALMAYADYEFQQIALDSLRSITRSFTIKGTNTQSPPVEEQNFINEEVNNNFQELPETKTDTLQIKTLFSSKLLFMFPNENHIREWDIGFLQKIGNFWAGLDALIVSKSRENTDINHWGLGLNVGGALRLGAAKKNAILFNGGPAIYFNGNDIATGLKLHLTFFPEGQNLGLGISASSYETKAGMNILFRIN